MLICLIYCQVDTFWLIFVINHCMSLCCKDVSSFDRNLSNLKFCQLSCHWQVDLLTCHFVLNFNFFLCHWSLHVPCAVKMSSFDNNLLMSHILLSIQMSDFCVIDHSVSLVLHRCLILSQQTVNMFQFCEVKFFCLFLKQAWSCFLKIAFDSNIGMWCMLCVHQTYT